MTPFVDEFRNEPVLLRAALEAAVGYLPEVEVLPTGWIKVDGRLCAPSSSRALDTAREALAVLVASARIERDAAAAGTPPFDPTRVVVEDAEVTTDADGIHVTGRIPADAAQFLGFGGPIAVSLRDPGDAVLCGATEKVNDAADRACILTAGHTGDHLIGTIR